MLGKGWLLRTQLYEGLSETRILAMKAKTTSACENLGLHGSCGPPAAISAVATAACQARLEHSPSLP